MIEIQNQVIQVAHKLVSTRQETFQPRSFPDWNFSSFSNNGFFRTSRVDVDGTVAQHALRVQLNRAVTMDGILEFRRDLQIHAYAIGSALQRDRIHLSR